MLKQLVLKTPWKNVCEAILRLYPDQADEIEEFREVFLSLRSFPAQESTARIYMEWPNPKSSNPRENVRISGIEAEGPDGEGGQKYALDYEPWENWLGMAIDEDTHNRFTDAEIIAACLWEMTFYASDPAAPLLAREKVERRMEEIENMSWDTLKTQSTKIGEVKGQEVWIFNRAIDEFGRKGK